ncbi:hypothetical protein [Ornithinimicrobium sediminis]|uniref:hypothetical protein n=1 Tax=Ornithinimicrobium sediminis TaxID=2904603 RepID=UPI001E2AA943|nr:hypothetical protein [Ornithinimicrobium sediminis]MCE0488045.1 hypothetical protein [Ornithinimicrobium sediminis]
MASAAPAYAQSPPPDCLDVAFSGDSCKCPGQGQNDFSYNLSVCFTNTCPAGSDPITVTVLRLVSNSGVTLCPTESEVLVIAPGATVCTATRWYFSANSANFIDVVYRIGDGPETSTPGQGLASPPDCGTQEGQASCEDAPESCVP